MRTCRRSHVAVAFLVLGALVSSPAFAADDLVADLEQALADV